MRARVACAMGIVVLAGLVGCASQLKSPADATPYVGVFTGEFVDGLPLYRFPTVEVVGSRRALAPDT